MALLSKVVWSEGMHLSPHHFQAQARYHEECLQFALSNLEFEPWGLIGFELSVDALLNGTVALIHARGLFRDGLAFHMPEPDIVPEPLSIVGAFPPTRKSLGVMLGVPVGARPRSGSAAATEPRFVPDKQVIKDENTGADV